MLLLSLSLPHSKDCTPTPECAAPIPLHLYCLLPAGTVGLYGQPVAILDFASLYPSIYRAHNLVGGFARLAACGWQVQQHTPAWEDARAALDAGMGLGQLAPTE